MITRFKRRSSPGRAWRRPLTVVVVVVAALALAPAAFADGWALQSAQTESNWAASGLNGVACPYPGTFSLTSRCIAVGYEQVTGGAPAALIELWSGSAWSIEMAGGPPGSSQSELDSVSCPSPAFCMAVGHYDTANGGGGPLVYTMNNGAWLQQNVPNGPQHFDSVSCQSSTFCVAVGEFAAVWNGSSFTPQTSISGGPPAAFLRSVSCAAAQSGFCVAVGDLFGLAQSTLPDAEAYENGQWFAKTGPGGAFPEPAGTSDAFLTGVYCITSQDCQVAGNYFTSSHVGEVWGAKLSGSTWSLTSLPPSNAFAELGTGGNNLTCPSDCWAVGSYAGASGQQVLADNLSGTVWGFASLPTPNGVAPQLNAVSCAQINYCEAVGSSSNAEGAVAVAEGYVYTPPPAGRGGKCTDPDCPPPKPGTPHHFALSASGPEAHGAAVIAVLHKPRTLVLLVQKVRHHRHVIVGLVPLGHDPIGTFRIPWNLRVDGKLLGKGTYEVTLRSISVDVLSPATPPGEITLTVGSHGQVIVGK